MVPRENPPHAVVNSPGVADSRRSSNGVARTPGGQSSPVFFTRRGDSARAAAVHPGASTTRHYSDARSPAHASRHPHYNERRYGHPGYAGGYRGYHNHYRHYYTPRYACYGGCRVGCAHLGHHYGYGSSYWFSFGFISSPGYYVDPYPVYYPYPVATYVETAPLVREIYVQEPVYVESAEVYPSDQPIITTPTVIDAPQYEYESYADDGGAFEPLTTETQAVPYTTDPLTPESAPPTSTPPASIEVVPDTGDMPSPAPQSEASPPETSRQASAPEPGKMSVEQVNALMEEGTQQFTQGQYDASARSFLKVMMDHENNVDSILAYAVSRFATGDYAASALAIRRGVLLYPDVVNSGFDMRDRYGRMEDYDDHYGRIVTFVLDQPSNIDGWVVLGFVQHFTGLHERAAEAWTTVKKLSDPLTPLADIFLNAKPPQPEASATEQDPEGSSPPTSEPAESGKSSEGTTRPEDARAPGSQPASTGNSADQPKAGTIIIRPSRPSASSKSEKSNTQREPALISLEPGYQLPSP